MSTKKVAVIAGVALLLWWLLRKKASGTTAAGSAASVDAIEAGLADGSLTPGAVVEDKNYQADLDELGYGTPNNTGPYAVTPYISPTRPKTEAVKPPQVGEGLRIPPFPSAGTQIPKKYIQSPDYCQRNPCGQLS